MTLPKSVLNLCWHCVALSAIFLSLTPAMAQPRLVDSGSNRDFPNINFEKYVLENGLTIIVHEDHSDPVVQVDVTYHVGSAADTPGKTGFAHFFEHMMFEGSQNVEEYFKTINEAGGFCNGTTNSDRTNYFQTVPSNQLEKVLWMEADRMGFLLPAVTTAKFNIQRSVIKNERDQRFTNRPYGLVNELVAENLYGKEHPYSWPVVGYPQDLDSATLEDLRAFFIRWYRPNNATLTIGGDVKTANVLKLVEKYFGSIPRGDSFPCLEVNRPVLRDDKIVTHFDNINFPMLQLVFPSVERFHKDEVALDALAYLLAGNKYSLLSKTLFDSHKVTNFSTSNLCKELGGKFEIVSTLVQGASIDSVESLVRSSLLGITNWERMDQSLGEFKSIRKLQLAKSLSMVATKVFLLANCQVLGGDPERFRDEYLAIEALGMDDVRDVYERYVNNHKCIVLKVLPGTRDKSLFSQRKNAKDHTSGLPDDSSPIPAQPAIIDLFDRSITPVQDKVIRTSSPKVWRHQFKNGAKVLGIRQMDTPLVSLLLTIDFSSYQVAQQKSNAEFYLLSQLLQRSGKKISREVRDQKLGALGSELSLSMRPGKFVVEIQSLESNLDSTLVILTDFLCNPLLDKGELEDVKREHLNYVVRQSTLPEVVAGNAFWEILFDSKGPFGTSLHGKPTEIREVKVEMLRAVYEGVMRYAQVSVAAVGPVNKSTLASQLNMINAFQSDARYAKTPAPIPSQIRETKIFLINKPNLTQSEIRIGYMLPIPYDVSGEYYLSTIANYTLGASFNSRLNLALREEKGWAYGARSQLHSSRTPGPFIAQAIVKGAATDSAVARMLHELDVFYRDGISSADLNFTKRSFGNFSAMKFEAPFQKANFLMEMLDYDAPRDFVKRQNRTLKKLTPEKMAKNIGSLMKSDKFVIIVVGDRSKIHASLNNLGYPVIDL